MVEVAGSEEKDLEEGTAMCIALSRESLHEA